MQCHTPALAQPDGLLYPRQLLVLVMNLELQELPAQLDVGPSPATHAILTVLKAGERVFQTFLLTKTAVHAYRGARLLYHALFWCQNTA